MQELKGAAWATIAAFARRAEFAPALWERLLQVRILAACIRTCDYMLSSQEFNQRQFLYLGL